MTRLSFDDAVPAAVMIARMADDLVNAGVTSNEADAIRALMGRYGYGDIVAFAGDALFEARQRGVKAAMAAR